MLTVRSPVPVNSISHSANKANRISCKLANDAEFDLPPSILDRLLASEIVPLAAKIKAVESWRLEVAEAHSRNPNTLALQRRLAAASRLLRRQKWKSIVRKTAEVGRTVAAVAIESSRRRYASVRRSRPAFPAL